jgi:hypothetical protein
MCRMRRWRRWKTWKRRRTRSRNWLRKTKDSSYKTEDSGYNLTGTERKKISVYAEELHDTYNAEFFFFQRYSFECSYILLVDFMGKG